MEQQLFDFAHERAETLSVSRYSTKTTKMAAQEWLDAVAGGRDGADAATERLLDILEGRPTSIEKAIQYATFSAHLTLGVEKAQELLAHQLERKSNGAKYCDCEACTAAVELLAEFGRIEL